MLDILRRFQSSYPYETKTTNRIEWRQNVHRVNTPVQIRPLKLRLYIIKEGFTEEYIVPPVPASKHTPLVQIRGGSNVYPQSMP